MLHLDRVIGMVYRHIDSIELEHVFFIMPLDNVLIFVFIISRRPLVDEAPVRFLFRCLFQDAQSIEMAMPVRYTV